MNKTKKLIILIVCIIAAVAVIGGGAAAYAINIAERNSIGEDKALEIALADAGVSNDKASRQRAHLSLEDGVLVYDVEFNVNMAEFEYEIKASDGTVIKKDIDGEYSAVTEPAPETRNMTTSQQNNNLTTEANTQGATPPENAISLDKAKAIALEHAKVNSNDAAFTKAVQDYDNGVFQYEIDFTANGYKYDYEIGADATILSWSADKIKTNENTSSKTASTQNENPQYIGEDKAKDAALSHSKVKKSDALFTKVKLEKDDGQWVYDIEFVVSRTEYDYEVNALNGKILKYSSEPVYD